ncbi:O-antigen ligase family protein [Paenibacillus agri]|uniref:O-antigen ligase family protein n=1 Tax=Paenibacillus agri TaxID=2744309 RepID=A0A850ETD3_9BACL|nr:O-antigen ligase family protein [Paenibacillus agri]NUU62949.1 O-antigen ligase family protein [Paenibacillus agri]
MSKPVYGKNVAQSKGSPKIESPIWVLVIVLILFLIWAPFQIGLFNGYRGDFEKSLYISVLVSLLMLLGWIALNASKFKITEQRDLILLAAVLLPVTYTLSLLVAVSNYSAMNMMFIQSMFAAVFIISVFLLKQARINIILQHSLLTIAYFIVAFGLLNWLGSWELAGKLVGWFSEPVHGGKYNDAVMTDSNGLRLTSIFQYANTYAAFLMAFLFVAVFALIRSRKGYARLAHGFMLVPVIVSILLTLSRGGLVMLPVVFILLLLFLKPLQQILWIVHLGIAGVISLIIAAPVTNAGIALNEVYTSSTALKGWGYLLGGSLIAAVLSWLIQRYATPWLGGKLHRLNSRKGSGLWIPLGSLLLAGIIAFLFIGTSMKNILPANMKTRLENINFNQHSVLERITFYKDAIKVVKDYPILGTGGGGWASLYEHYQNNPYISHQVHNFFLQYLIEVGILGFIVFMGFILYIVYKYLIAYVKRETDEYNNGFFYLIIALSILLHSLLDFNLSYAFMGILVFIGLAGMAVTMDSKPLKRNWNKQWLRWGYFSVLGAGSFILLFILAGYISSTNAIAKGKQLLRVSQTYEEIKAPFVKALNQRPGHPEASIYLSSLDQQVFNQTRNEQFLDESYQVVTRALTNEPYNKQLLTQLADYYDLNGQGNLALGVYRDHADNFVWDIKWVDTLISRSLNMGTAANTRGDEVEKQAYFNLGLEAYAKVLAGVEYLKTLPQEQLQGRPYLVTPTIALNVGKMQLLSGEPEKAQATLRLGFNENYADLLNNNNLWEMDWYGTLISRTYDQGLAAFKGDDEDNMEANLNFGLQAYNQILADLEYWNTLPPEKLEGKQLTIPPAITLNAGKMKMITGKLQDAAATLKSGLSEDYSDATNREIARWYLAALKRANADLDQTIYDKLLAADPAESAQVDTAAALQF